MDPIFSTLDAQVAATTTVEKSAKLLIDGFQAQLAAGIAAAVAGGATPAAVQKLTDLDNALKSSSTGLAASVAANTPPPPPLPPALPGGAMKGKPKP